jgi:hypothetical protein
LKKPDNTSTNMAQPSENYAPALALKSNSKSRISESYKTQREEFEKLRPTMGVSSASGQAYRDRILARESAIASGKFLHDATEAATTLEGLGKRMEMYRDAYVRSRIGMAHVFREATDLENIFIMVSALSGEAYTPSLGKGRYLYEGGDRDYVNVSAALHDMRSWMSKHAATLALVMRTNKRALSYTEALVEASYIPETLEEDVVAVSASTTGSEAITLLETLEDYINK